MSDEYQPFPFYDGHVQQRLLRRANGDCVCDRCGLTYARHPMDPDHLSGIDGEPYLNRLCDGSLVKL